MSWINQTSPIPDHYVQFQFGSSSLSFVEDFALRQPFQMISKGIPGRQGKVGREKTFNISTLRLVEGNFWILWDWIWKICRLVALLSSRVSDLAHVTNKPHVWQIKIGEKRNLNRRNFCLPKGSFLTRPQLKFSWDGWHAAWYAKQRNAWCREVRFGEDLCQVSGTTTFQCEQSCYSTDLIPSPDVYVLEMYFRARWWIVERTAGMIPLCLWPKCSMVRIGHPFPVKRKVTWPSDTVNFSPIRL